MGVMFQKQIRMSDFSEDEQAAAIDYYFSHEDSESIHDKCKRLRLDVRRVEDCVLLIEESHLAQGLRDERRRNGE